MPSIVIDRSEVLEVLQAGCEDLRSLGVRRIGLFGSFVRDAQTAESDVDILVEFEPGQKTFSNFMSLATYLEESLGRRVEVVTRESLSPYLGPHILQEVEYVTVAA